MTKEPKVLDSSAKQEVTYCVPLWVRDEQIKLAIERVPGRIEGHDLRNEPCAIVCFGPSLNDTWEQVKNFKYIFTGSGSHKFLVERGITPTFHVEVDPRPHKVKLIGQPQKETEYLIASACHPAVFDLLEGYNVKLWHVFQNEEEANRIVPRGEYSITGGSSVGLRMLTIARFLGFTDFHIFGMDGSFPNNDGKHAAEHPNEPKDYCITVYDGVEYKTTQSMLHCAQETWRELDMLPDVKTTFYGEGLVQHMARHYVPNHIDKKHTAIAARKPKLISDEYVELNKKLFKEHVSYGVGGARHANNVLRLAESVKRDTGQEYVSILDYGCGRSYLQKALPFPIFEYDPCVPGKEQAPQPADIVVCTDVLEHIEPDYLDFVLDDLRRCVKHIGYFVIHTGPSSKVLADGRNCHLIQKKKTWWKNKLSKYFAVSQKGIMERSPHLYIVVGVKKG